MYSPIACGMSKVLGKLQWRDKVAFVDLASDLQQAVDLSDTGSPDVDHRPFVPHYAAQSQAQALPPFAHCAQSLLGQKGCP